MLVRPWVLVLALAACDRHHESSAAPATDEASKLVATAPSAAAAPARERFDAAELVVPPGKSTLHVAWALPAGTGINDDAPFSVRWGSSDGLATPPADVHGVGKQVAAGFDVPLDLMPSATGGQLAGDVDVVVCDIVTHSVCLPLKRRLELTFAVNKGAAAARITLPLPQAAP